MAVQTAFDIDQLTWQLNQTTILDRVSFRVGQGEFVGLIGPNGAGKSSLLRCLYRYVTPTAGDIRFFEQPLYEFSRRRLAQQLAVLLQEPPSQFDITVIDVIRMGLTPHKHLLSVDDQHDFLLINDAAQQVSIDHKLHQSFSSLSGGEKQRAMIARVIVQRPKVLLMDEPTNHLDVQHQFEVLECARQMGITVIVSIHDLNLAAEFCDRLVLLDRGKLIKQGPPAEVLTQSNIEQVFKVQAKTEPHPFHQGLRITLGKMKPEAKGNQQ